MSMTRKQRRIEQANIRRAMKKANRQNIQRKTVASFALATIVAGSSATFVATPSFANTGVVVSDISNGYIDAPTLNSLKIEEENGAYYLTVNPYQQAGETAEVTSKVETKMVAGDGTAEKATLDEAKQAEAQQKIVMDSALADYRKWSSITWVEDPETLELVVTFADGSTRAFANEDEINTARDVSRSNLETQEAKYQELASERQQAQMAYDEATTPRPDLSNYTLSLAVTNSPYASNVWETSEGGIEEGDTFSLGAPGVFGTATVTQADANGNLVLDVKFTEALPTEAQTRVLYTAVEPTVEEQPGELGEAVADSVDMTWTGSEQVIDVLGNDKPQEGSEWTDFSLTVIDPATGQKVPQVSVEGVGTWTATYDRQITFLGERAFTGTASISYVAIDSNGNEYTSTVTVNHTGEESWVPTEPTDGSGVDISDASKHYTAVDAHSKYVPVEYKNDPRWSSFNGLISAEDPTALNDLAVVTQNSRVAVNVFTNDNAGMALDERFNYDAKAQDRFIEDASLQILDPDSGKHVAIGTAVNVDGKATATIIPATGTDSIVPVETVYGETKFAYNRFNRPLVAVDGAREHLGLVEIPYRWKTSAYGETTADLDAFWAEYDATGAGAEFVGTGTIYLNFEAPNLVKGTSIGRASELNPVAEKPTGVFSPELYTKSGTTTGSGIGQPLMALGQDDTAVTTAGKSVSFSVAENDHTARLSRNFTNASAGSSFYGEKPVGIKTADGELVDSLAIDGQGEWHLRYETLFVDADGKSSPTEVEGGSWSKQAHLIFIAEDGFTGRSTVTFVNENLAYLPANGIPVSADGSPAEFEADLSTLKLIDANGALVDSVTIPEEGTYTVVDGQIEFVPADEFVGKSTVEYSVVDRWVGTAQQQQLADYDLTVKPYGAESRALATVNVLAGETPVEVPEIPEEPPVDVPEVPEIPAPEIPEEPPVEEEEKPLPEIPEEPPVIEIPTPEQTVPEQPPVKEEVPTPDTSIVPEDEPVVPTPDTSIVPELPIVPVDIPVDIPTPDTSIVTDVVEEDAGGFSDMAEEESALTGVEYETALITAGFGAMFVAGFVTLALRNRKRAEANN